MRIVALDFETSGLDPKTHAPVTLGVAVMDGDDVAASQEWLFAPPTDKNGKITREYSIAAMEINGIPWPKVKREGLPISKVMYELREFAALHAVSGATVVAFNAPFDLAWYSECLFMGGSWNQALRRFETFSPPLVGPWQCARLMACSQIELDAYNLDAVAGYFKLARESEKHGALEDAILAGQVFNRLRQDAKQEAA